LSETLPRGGRERRENRRRWPRGRANKAPRGRDRVGRRARHAHRRPTAGCDRIAPVLLTAAVGFAPPAPIMQAACGGGRGD